jgi:two-component system, OmpR family, phosphate regulon sensor histidine kinase PhoR
MHPVAPVWTIAAAILVAAVTAVSLLLGAPFEVALIFLIGGAGAVLLAIYPQFSMREPEPDDGAVRQDGDAVDPLQAITDPVLMVREGRVVYANGAALRLLGRHALGEDLRTAIRHPGAAEHLANPTADGIELVGLGARDQRWLMRVAELPDGRRLVHLIDRSLAHAAERMRVDFVANASHELRTPLAAILGFAETLAGEAGAEDATRTRFLGVITQEAQRMQTLVDDLISLSRIEADKHRAPDDAVDLAGLASEVTQVVGTQPASKDRTITLTAEPQLPAVAGDRAQLSQLLHNIIGNAIKYGRAGSPVRVTLESGGGMVCLSVADEGEGIEPQHLTRLTERFYRVDSGRSRAMGGTGLGLSIVKHIVERHRGRLDITSVPGTGTTVTVVLPQARESLSQK